MLSATILLSTLTHFSLETHKEVIGSGDPQRGNWQTAQTQIICRRMLNKISNKTRQLIGIPPTKLMFPGKTVNSRYNNSIGF